MIIERMYLCYQKNSLDLPYKILFLPVNSLRRLILTAAFGPSISTWEWCFLIKKSLTYKDKGAPWRPFALQRSSQYKGKETPSV